MAGGWTINPEVGEVAEQVTDVQAVVLTGAAVAGTGLSLALIWRALSSVYAVIGKSYWSLPWELGMTAIKWLGAVTGLWWARGMATGVSFDSATGQAIPNVLLVFYSESGNLKTVYTDRAGRYRAQSAPDDYQIRAEKTNYLFPPKQVTAIGRGKVYQAGEKITVGGDKWIPAVSVALEPKGKVKWGWLVVVGKTAGLATALLAYLYRPGVVAMIVIAYYVLSLITGWVAKARATQ